MTITNGRYLVHSGQTIRYSNHGQESLLVGEITENSKDYRCGTLLRPQSLDLLPDNPVEETGWLAPDQTRKDLRLLMYSDNPVKEQRRRRITLGIIAVLIIGSALFGFHFFHSYRRTSTADQTKLMNSNEPAVVMFYSRTCKDCKHVAATVHKNDYQSKLADNVVGIGNASNYRHTAVYIELQNSHDKQLFEQYHVTSTPTFMIFKNGQPQPIQTVNGLPVYQYSGTNKAKIQQLYQKLSLD